MRIGRNARRSERGMTFVEVLVAVGVLAVSVGGFVMAVLSAHSASAASREREMVRGQAFKYMERLLAVPYGTQADSAASAAAVEELFDDDGVVTSGGGLSLMSLRTPVNSDGWRFRIHGFEADGVFEVEVNSDLDGNGVGNGIRGIETPTTGFGSHVAGDGVSLVALNSENDPNLLRIEIFWNGEPVLRTYRAAPPEGT